MIVVAEWLVGIAAAFLIVKYLVLPAIRAKSGSGGTGSSKLPGDGGQDKIP